MALVVGTIEFLGKKTCLHKYYRQRLAGREKFLYFIDLSEDQFWSLITTTNPHGGSVSPHTNKSTWGNQLAHTQIYMEESASPCTNPNGGIC